MTREELANLIYEVTNEVLQNNQSIIEECNLPKTIELAVQFSCAANLSLLQKLGLIDDEFKPLS